ncbi:hypothetical protein F2Q69_00033009 [Brassica cretica]|uniref:Uncharacterized protein n=1 Tax=Brassica cretica TaxID=69181 RepID=A0A8S9SH05_BRACR|nr:hypothetical protein F2Q69_00033009 [Brassica cretica]
MGMTLVWLVMSLTMLCLWFLGKQRKDGLVADPWLGSRYSRASYGAMSEQPSMTFI